MAQPADGQIGGGRTKILLVAAKPEPDLSRRLSTVIEAYKAQSTSNPSVLLPATLVQLLDKQHPDPVS